MSRKVFLVGDGAVGSTFANDLLQNTIVDELAIFDVAKDRPVGDSMDLEDITPFMGQTNIHPAADYSDAKDADVCVITAGVPEGVFGVLWGILGSYGIFGGSLWGILGSWRV